MGRNKQLSVSFVLTLNPRDTREIASLESIIASKILSALKVVLHHGLSLKDVSMN